MNLTILIIIITVIFLIAFDVYIIAKKGKQESISAHIIRGSKQYPLAVLLFGMLLGHLFFSMKTEDIYYNTECTTKDI
tara:strand:- start:3756 stop:3989 length:234 start_codon:yes stop_codon:yes gene_type:complete